MSALKPYPAYKDSGISWIGEVREDWIVLPTKVVLREAKTEVGSRWAETRLLSLTRQGIIERDIDSGKGKFPTSFEGYQLVEPEDLVFCLFDVEETPRTVGLVQQYGMLTSAYTRFRVNQEIACPRFLEYYFVAIDNEKRFRPIYSGLRNVIQKNTFLQAGIALPELHLQQAIAVFLDRETAEIDEFVAESEKLITLLNERRAAVITQAVTKGLDPTAPMKDTGIEWLGQVPAAWDIQRLGNTVKEVRNGIWGEEPQGGTSLRCVRVADFDRHKLTIQDRDVTFREFKSAELSGRVLRRGDLLLEKSGGGEKSPVGFVVRYDREDPAVCSNFVARIVLHRDMDSRFWTYVHRCLYAGRITERSVKQATGIQNLDQSSYFNERVAVPQYSEQRIVADFLDTQMATIDEAIATAREAIALAKERRQALISAAVTGKIDVRAAA